MEDISFFIDLIENQPPYKKMPISLQNFAALAQQKSIKLDSYCETCSKERTFLQNHLDNSLQSLRREAMKRSPRPDEGGEGKSSTIKHDDAEAYESHFIAFVVNCAYCEEEHFYAFRIDGSSICKIGQYPSFSHEKTVLLQRYKNLISKYYVELTSAMNVYSQKLGIAAFVYLRRILEHLIDTKYFRLPDANEQAKFIEKLKAVEKTEVVIPNELAETKEQIYSVLSKGVHEYTEPECLALFEAVLHVVTVILDQELYKREREEKALEAKRTIMKKLKET